MYQNLGNFIDEKWSNNTKEKISVVNPCNEELLGTIPSLERGKTLTKPYNPQKKQWRAGENFSLGEVKNNQKNCR